MWLKDFFSKLVFICKEVFFLVPVDEPKTWNALWVSLVFAGVGGILLIGIPGALLMVGMQQILNRFGVQTPPSNEATWGIAILISLVMPLSLPLTHFLTRWRFPKSVVALIGVTLVWWLVLAVFGALAKAK